MRTARMAALSPAVSQRKGHRHEGNLPWSDLLNGQGNVAAGADGSADATTDHLVPWGVHRQGGSTDPFGHVWLVGDSSPLSRQQA